MKMMVAFRQVCADTPPHRIAGAIGDEQWPYSVTMTIWHHMTRSVAAHARRADAVPVAVGVPNLQTGHLVKPRAAFIDLGINQVTDAYGTSRIVSEADKAAVAEVASWAKPVPGGFGPVTVSMLMRTATIAFKK